MDELEIRLNEETFNSIADKELEVQAQIYHEDGKTITYDHWAKDKTIVAKSINYPHLGVTRYYVKRYGCEFYDPTAISSQYGKKDWKFGPVNERAFGLYLAYLGFRDKPKIDMDDEVSLKGRRYLKQSAENIATNG